MNFPKEFFKNEIIDGFEVSAMMKRCWAAQMEVLEQFDDMCRKHSIKYFLADGTLLGAVRHKGFIPWDDDIDIWMFGDDIDRLFNEMQTDIENAGFNILSPFTVKKKSILNIAYRINNSKYTYCLHEDFLKKYWLFPFVAGLDIFTLNYIPRDTVYQNDLKQIYTSVITLGTLWDDTGIPEEDKMYTYTQIIEMLGVEPVDKGDIFGHLWQLADRIGHMFGEEESDMVAELTAYYNNPRKIYRKEWFSETVYLEFAGKKFPCPSGYKDVLAADFGDDYMEPKIIPGDHVYPYYKDQHKEMLDDFEKSGISCPEFFRNI